MIACKDIVEEGRDFEAEGSFWTLRKFKRPESGDAASSALPYLGRVDVRAQY